MKQVILHVLCEGQTEDRFVSLVLSPYLQRYNIVAKHQILVTSKKKGVYGGVLNYGQVKRDLDLMFRQFHDTHFETHWFTTMFDLYALPTNFPGFDRTITNPYNRVEHVEESFGNDICNDRLIPYIQLHEFESLVFTDLDYLLTEYPNAQKTVERLKTVLLQKQNNPELVNDGVDTAPSKRIIAELEKCGHDYNKVKVGPACTEQKGVEMLKQECRHFAEWIAKLELLGNY